MIKEWLKSPRKPHEIHIFMLACFALAAIAGIGLAEIVLRLGL